MLIGISLVQCAHKVRIPLYQNENYMRKFSFFFSPEVDISYILLSDTHCYRLRLLLLDAIVVEVMNQVIAN